MRVMNKIIISPRLSQRLTMNEMYEYEGFSKHKRHKPPTLSVSATLLSRFEVLLLRPAENKGWAVGVERPHCLEQMVFSNSVGGGGAHIMCACGVGV